MVQDNAPDNFFDAHPTLTTLTEHPGENVIQRRNAGNDPYGCPTFWHVADNCRSGIALRRAINDGRSGVDWVQYYKAGVSHPDQITQLLQPSVDHPTNCSYRVLCPTKDVIQDAVVG